MDKNKPRNITKSILTLASSESIVKILPIFFSPIFSRIFTPREFGVLGIFLSIYAILGSITTLRFDAVIILPQKKEQALNSYSLALICSLLTSILIGLIILIFYIFFQKIIETSSLSLYLFLIPISLLFFGSYESTYYYFNREKKYYILAVIGIIQSLSLVILRLIWGFFKLPGNGLIYTIVFSLFISVIVIFFLFLKSNINKNFNISFQGIKSIFIEYRNYPQKSLVGLLLNNLSLNFEYILLSFYFPVLYIGYYFFVKSKILIVKSIFQKTTWRIFIGENQNKSKDIILNSLLSNQKKLMEIITLPLITSLFIIPQLFIIIFGQDWSKATMFLYPLILALHVNILVSSFSLFLILNKPEAEMKFNFLLVALKLSGLLIGIFIFKNILISIIIFSFFQILLFIFLGDWNYQQLGKSKNFFIKFYFKSLLKISPILLIYLIIHIIFNCFYLDVIIFLTINIINYIIFFKKYGSKH